MVPLLDRLPDVRGSYRENHDIAPLTWFRVGGPAQVGGDDDVRTQRREQRRGGIGVMGMDMKEDDYIEHLFVAS